MAVYSDADRSSMHVRYADEAYRLGPAASTESYLNIDKILEIAKACKADAIHRGYGFLSENSKFATMVRKAGIIFIGPSAEAIDAMGDKMTARDLMKKAGVTIVPGTDQLPESEDEIKKLAKQIGYPVMLKASAGGGGKGMRLVKKEKELIPSLLRARSEARNAFSNETVYMEVS